MSARRTLAPVVALVAIATVLLVDTPRPAAAANTTPRRPSRLLVLSVPTLTWADLRAHPMPNLERLLAGSAVGDLSARVIRHHTNLGDGYTTLSAGTRAEGVAAVDALDFGVDEPYGTERAGDVYRARTGRDPGTGLVDLGIAAVVRRNASLLYDAKIGATGDALAAAGWSRAVIANADGGEPDVGLTALRRTAARALMGHDGTVPAGRVDASLLVHDPAAPFGLRLDQRAVTGAFDAVWHDKSVVLVEASDLVRADEYRQYATTAQRTQLLATAMHETDDLVGALLARVDLSRDAVLVVGPANPAGSTALTVTALHAPGVPAGYVRSATTRRDGFVQLVDVAPTMLARLGVARPESMEGRPYEAVRSGSSLAARMRFLADANHAARFRDGQTPLVSTVYVSLNLTLVTVAMAVLWIPGRRRWGRVLEWVALGLLVFLPVTFLAGAVPFDDLGAGPYWAFLVVVSAALAGLFELARRRVLDPLVAALGFVVALLSVDVVTGGRLQFNTALGYSPTVAGRFQGMGNLAYSMYAAAGMLLAGLLVHVVANTRQGTRRRAIGAAVLVLAILVVVDGFPMFGADVGGVLSILPAAGVLVMLLLGLRVRWRTALAWFGAGVLAMVALGLLDLARPADQRTHLGRLFEKIGNGDLSGFTTVIDRKLHENLNVLTTSIWTLMLPAVFLFIAYLVYRAPGRLGIIQSRIPELRAALTGLLVVGVLGFALNDSGIAIPGVMLGVLNATLVYLAVREPVDLPPPELPAWARVPARPPVPEPSELS